MRYLSWIFVFLLSSFVVDSLSAFSEKESFSASAECFGDNCPVKDTEAAYIQTRNAGEEEVEHGVFWSVKEVDFEGDVRHHFTLATPETMYISFSNGWLYLLCDLPQVEYKLSFRMEGAYQAPETFTEFKQFILNQFPKEFKIVKTKEVTSFKEGIVYRLYLDVQTKQAKKVDQKYSIIATDNGLFTLCVMGKYLDKAKLFFNSFRPL